MLRRLPGVGSALLLALTLAGCSGGSPSAPTSEAPRLSARPKVGACYLIDVPAALRTSNTAAPVSCATRHTAVTVLVDDVDPVVNGKTLRIDSAPVQKRIAKSCRSKVDAHVGGSAEQQRLSRVQAVWFSPPAADVDAGVLWFRCDLVIGSTKTAFATLPRKTAGLLTTLANRNRYATCGTTAPGAAGFARVLCSAPHHWRARTTISLPAGTKYLAKDAGTRAQATCRGVEERRSATSLMLKWSFEWPTRAQWAGGQRYGLCWTPDP